MFLYSSNILIIINNELFVTDVLQCLANDFSLCLPIEVQKFFIREEV